MSGPMISVVVPVYRSSGTLAELTDRLRATLDPLTSGAWEVILVNYGSPDDSWAVISRLCASDARLVGINLMRNFGQHNAVMCGFAHAGGDYVVTLDDDLQNPPEEIPRLLNKLNEGFDVVYGTSIETTRRSLFRNLGSQMVVGTFKRIFGVDIDITTFRIIRGQVVRQILSYQRSFTYVDGIIAWHTTNLGATPVEHKPRAVGRSGYSLGKLLNLSINLLTNFSLFPLRSATLLGFAFSFFGFAMAAFFLAKKLIQDIPVSGFATTIIAVTLLSGTQLLTVGVLGEYIGRIHINISNRPQYAVRERLNARTQDPAS
jgi:undecaprenyl-phosphate 4-deoxy-4-formamido-L-arabinose transferase